MVLVFIQLEANIVLFVDWWTSVDFLTWWIEYVFFVPGQQGNTYYIYVIFELVI